MPLNDDACYAAISTRDARYDGWFFGAVRTTGIYCRPSCPARTPLRRNMRFFPTAAAAQQAGYRACRRCRPDAVPGSPRYDHAADLAARAVRLVDDGYVERHGVEGLAGRLGYSTRQLNRILIAELGAGPLQLARARRAHAARILVQTTQLSFADVAFAAGFGSIRQFNDTIRAVFGTTPGELRGQTAAPDRMVAAATDGRSAGVACEVRAASLDERMAITLRLPFRPPFDASSISEYLTAHLVPGVEVMDGATYRRVLTLPHGPGIAELTPRPEWVLAKLRLTDLRDLPAAVARCRRLLDLDADTVERALAFDESDPLAALAARYPGMRVAGSTDPFETAVRTVLGQQVTLAAGSRLASFLAQRSGDRIDDPAGTLTHAFPSPDGVLDALPLPMPSARNATVAALARAVRDGDLVLDHAAAFASTAHALGALPGIGAWTRDYIRLRALGDPDAFPAGDLALRKQAERLGLPATTRELDQHARRWSPVRSLAAQLLWTDYLRTSSSTDTPVTPDERLLA